MLTQEIALERGKWWSHFIKGDVAAARACLAPDVVRIGPRSKDNNHIMRGREEYCAYLQALLDTMPRLNESVLESIIASPDGRKVHLQITEMDSIEPGSRVKIYPAQAVMICELNDDALISKIDVYWKTPDIDYEWAGTERE